MSPENVEVLWRVTDVMDAELGLALLDTLQRGQGRASLTQGGTRRAR